MAEDAASGGLPPPGWYTDPAGTTGQRWWDGSEWTDHLSSPGAGATETESPYVARRDSSDPAPDVDAEVAELFGKLRGRVKTVLSQNLSPDEAVRAVIRGANGQAIIGTDRRAFVCKPGWMAGATLGAEVTTYNYLNVTGVQLHKGMVTGTVAIETGQQMAKTSVWKQGDADTYKAPNAIPVGGDWNEVRAGVARLRQLVDVAHSGMIGQRAEAESIPAGSAPQAASVADELSKLAELRASGVLSDDEFAAAKRRLLSS